MNNIAIIFDLDDTILPTRSIPASTFQPVFDSISKANQGNLSSTELQDAFEELWRKPIDVVAENYGFSKLMISAGKNALLNTDYQFTLSPFDDYDHLRDIANKKFLVTTGITKLQQAKINALFQENDFQEMIIDDTYQIDRLGKKNIFADIAKRYDLASNQIWIIGDNPDSEIAAGNALGMITVQILRPGIEPTNDANYVIYSFSELKALIEKHYEL